MHPEYNFLNDKQLRQQASFVEKKQLTLESNLQTENVLAATGTGDLVQMDRRNIQENIPSVECKQIDEATLNHIKERFIHTVL